MFAVLLHSSHLFLQEYKQECSDGKESTERVIACRADTHPAHSAECHSTNSAVNINRT